MRKIPFIISGKHIFTIIISLVVFQIQAQRPSFKKVKLPDEIRSINALLSENEEAVWLATAQGLYRYNDRKFTRFYEDDKAQLYQINAIAKDDKGAMWFGTYNGTLVKFSDNKIEKSIDIKPLCKNNNYLITSLDIDKINKTRNTAILLTTSGGEVFSVNTNNDQVKKIESPSDATIYSVLYGYNPTVWLCTSDGFYTMTKSLRWKKKAGLYTAYGLAENEDKYWAIGRDEQKKAVLMLYFSEKKNSSKKRFIWKDLDLSKLNDRYTRFYKFGFTQGEIAWITSESGLVKYNPVTASVKLYEKDKKLDLKGIQHIAVQNNKLLWISSSGKRLIRVELK